jgi:hypothetical protein
MWKDVAILGHSISEHSHVMYRTRPSNKNKCESHVEVTNSEHILCCHALAAHVLNQLITWHHTWYVSAIWCSYIIVEEGIEPRICQPRMNCSEFWVNWLNDDCNRTD